MKKSLFDIFDPDGIKWIFQLRVGLSQLRSHKNAHNFQDTPDDKCCCTLNSETTIHYLLHCTNFVEQRRELFRVLNPLLNNLRFLNDEHLVRLLLYGDDIFEYETNQSILKATIDFIRRTSRLCSVQR